MQCGSNFHLCKYNILICSLHYFERHKVSSLLHTDQICSLDTYVTLSLSPPHLVHFLFSLIYKSILLSQAQKPLHLTDQITTSWLSFSGYESNPIATIRVR